MNLYLLVWLIGGALAYGMLCFLYLIIRHLRNKGKISLPKNIKNLFEEKK